MLKLKWSFNGLRRTISCFHSLNSCRSSKLYSTSAASEDEAEYLDKSVGFAGDETVSIATKVTSHLFNSTENSSLVIDFLKNSGFKRSHIRELVASIPTVLHSDVEKTLKPKIRAFQELGFSGSDLGLIISQHPYVLIQSLKAHIVISIHMLKSLLGSNEQLVKFMLKTKSRRLFNSDKTLKSVPDNLLLLQSYGLPRERIKWFLQRRPVIFLQRAQWVEQIVNRVEEKIGIPRTSAMFLHGVDAMSKKSGDKFEQWCDIFRGFGWSESEILLLLRRHPLAMNLSEKELRAKLKYFMEELGYGSDYLASHPVLLSHSMEKKIVPRVAFIQALRDKHLLKREIGIYTTLCKAESRFVEMYVLPFKDELPELFEYYVKTTGRALSL